MFFKKSGKKIFKNIIAALDIGSSKICCAISSIDQKGELQLLGIGQQASFGLKNGFIVEMKAVKKSISNAVHLAERMAQETISKVYVNISANQLNFHRIHEELPILDNEIKEAHIDALFNKSWRNFHEKDIEIIHTIPANYNIDGLKGIRDPRGMFGNKLSADIHLITTKPGPLKNLLTCISNAHLDVIDFIASPFAAGLASLVDDEMNLGVTVVDLGAGSTGISSFLNGDLVFVGTIPIGGNHITYDIARGLSTPIIHAERIKNLYGNASVSSDDNRESIFVPQIGETNQTQGVKIPKLSLNQIIQPRVEETFELIKSCIQGNQLAKVTGDKIVLTGGASQLSGIKELSEKILNRQVRIGIPININVNEKISIKNPSFSTCLGLFSYALKQENKKREFVMDGDINNFWRSTWRWLRENL